MCSFVPQALFVLACLCSGLSGNVPGFLSGNASYISDTDSPRRRSLRLAIVEMSVGLTFGVASLINGYWVSTRLISGYWVSTRLISRYWVSTRLINGYWVSTTSVGAG